MREMLGRIWEYIWTKGTRENVFGGLILLAITTAVGSIWLWSKSGFSANAATAWMAATSSMSVVWAWLAHPIGVPRGLLWLAGIAILGLCRPSFRTVVGLLRRVSNSLFAANEKLFDVAGSMLEPSGTIQPLLKKEPLSENALELLTAIMSVYPLTLPIGQLCETQRLSYAAVEQMIEELEQAGYVKINEGSQTRGKSVCLTKSGRDYALRRGLDLIA
jgi:DNA-binding MarR family transcriptional regulator